MSCFCLQGEIGHLHADYRNRDERILYNVDG